MAYKDIVKQDLPIAYWRLDEESGTTAVDEMGGHDGTINGDPVLGASPLIQSGTAYEFDGSGDWVNISGVEANANGASEGAFSAWVQANAVSSTIAVIEFGSSSTADEGVFLRIISTGEFDFNYRAGATNYSVQSTANTDTHFLVGVWDSSSVYLYVDGVLIGSVSRGGTVSGLDRAAISAKAQEENDPFGDSFNFLGIIDEPAIYDRALTATEIRRHYYAGLGYSGYALEALAHGPVAYWRLDEESGATTAVDEVGGNDGTYNGSPTLGVNPLVQSGTAVEFDGSDDYVATNWDGILGSNDRSVEAWIKTASDGVIVEWGTGSSGNVFGFQLNDSSDHGTVGALRVDVWNGRIVGSTDLRDDSPHYVVVTGADASAVEDLRLFVDSIEESLSSSTAQSMNTIADTPVSIGRSETGVSDWFFNGIIDEVAIYDRALSATEIRRHYYAGLGYTGYPLSVLAHGPVAYWRLDEESGTTAADETGDHDGTYNGSPTLGQNSLIRSGTAVEFDGSDDYVDAGTLGSFGSDINNGFTFGVWVRWTSASVQSIAGTVNNNDDTYFQCTANQDENGDNAEGRVRIALRGSGDVRKDRVTARNDLNDGNSHLITVRLDGGSAVPDIYVDGVIDNGGSVDEGSFTTTDFEYPLMLGARNLRGTADQYFSGTIDEPVLYDRALTEAEIQEHYGLGLYGGLFYRIGGTVNLDGSPGAADVRALDFATNEVIGETTSAGDGTYEIADLEDNPDLLVVAEADGYRPLAHGPVTPEEM